MVGDRFANALKSIGLKKTELAIELGVTKAAVSDIIHGRVKKISGTMIELLKIKYNINPSYLLTGEGPIFLHEANDVLPLSALIDDPNRDHFFHVPVVGLAKCGPDGIESAEHDEILPIPVHIIRREYRRRKLFALRAYGGSMVPWILPGDVVLFMEERKIEGENIYAVWFDGPMIKRVYITDEMLVLGSYNSRYAPIPVHPDHEHDLHIFGVAIYVFREFTLKRGTPRALMPRPTAARRRGKRKAADRDVGGIGDGEG